MNLYIFVPLVAPLELKHQGPLLKLLPRGNRFGIFPSTNWCPPQTMYVEEPIVSWDSFPGGSGKIQKHLGIPQSSK